MGFTGAAEDGSWSMGDYYKHVFEEFDANKNGELDAKELEAALTKLGKKVSFEDLDTDGDGKISLEEFKMLALMVETYNHSIYKQPLMSKCADLLETDQAKIKEAKSICSKLLSSARVDDTTLLREFHRLDNDGDARLTKKEFKKIIQKYLPTATMGEQQIMLFTVFSVADINRDDTVTFDEFKAVMQYK